MIGVTSSHSTPYLQQILEQLDQLTENLGLNVPTIVEMDKLRNLPKGSFGRSVADFLDANQITPFTNGVRRKQLHDIVHVVTGYGTDLLGELEVQAFLMGTNFRPFHLLLSFGIMRIIRKQSLYSPLFVKKRLWEAYQRG